MFPETAGLLSEGVCHGYWSRVSVGSAQDWIDHFIDLHCFRSRLSVIRLGDIGNDISLLWVVEGYSPLGLSLYSD